MSLSARSRRFIALFAAYLVALQALLLPLSLAAGGTLGGSLCAAVQTIENQQSPMDHPSSCPCAAGCGMQCCIQALSGPPHITIAIADMRAGVTTPAPVADGALRIPMRRQPQIPRAPPAA